MEANVDTRIGVNILKQVKTLYSAPIKINPDFKMPKIQVKEVNPSRTHVCTCCGTSYKKLEGNFLKAGANSIFWQANKGFMPICKTCAETIFNALVDFYSGNEEHAFHHWCAIFDYPYDVIASAMTATHVQPGRSRVSLYPAKLNTKQVRDRGTSYLDTVRFEAGEEMRIRKVEDIIKDEEEAAEGFTVTKEMLKKWGYGHKPEEYEWLEEQEEDWRSRVECKSKAQEELIRTICIAQFNIQKAQQGGGKLAEAMKSFQDLLASCNLQPRQTAGDELADQNTFGTLIRQFEQERPIPEADPEWEDVDNIKDYIDTYFLGHLCKLVHVENDCSEKYMKEIEKHTVKPPVYEGDEDSVDVTLLDKFSDKGDKQ